MDGLKRSLEEAIKEMQDVPAATQPSVRHDSDLRLARAADTLQTMHPMPEPVAPKAPTVAAQSAPSFIPAANSIEAALSSAPAVSPHYVAPEPVAAPVTETVVQAAPYVASAPPQPAPQKPMPKRRALRFGIPKIARPGPAQPALKISSTFPNQHSHRPEQNGPSGLDLGGVGDLADDVALKAKKLRDNIWRWATIGVSCAGGLASGWLGSNITNQPNGIFQATVQTIVGKSSDSAGSMRPASIKIVPQGAAKFMSGTAIGGLPVNLTGKTDRAVPQNDDLCTVLELDRGTGLTLARPCKMIETAEFNSTLGKADLLAKPRQ